MVFGKSNLSQTTIEEFGTVGWAKSESDAFREDFQARLRRAIRLNTQMMFNNTAASNFGKLVVRLRAAAA